MDLITKNEEIVTLNTDSIYKDAKSDEESDKPVSLTFAESNAKLRDSGNYEIPKPKLYDLTLTTDLSEEISKVPETQYVFIHPNDPKLDIVPKPVQRQYNAPIMLHNPVAAVQQSELYRQQQAQRYALGQQYIANRGQLNYSFNNPSGIPSIRRFQDDMNRMVNDPSRIIDAVKPESDSSGEPFVRVNGMSREEYNDRNYERDAKDRQEMAESLKKTRFLPYQENKDSYIPKKHVPYNEMKKRMANPNTPETYDTNFKTRSGDELLHIGNNNSVFTDNEKMNAYSRANAEYEAQKQAILSKRPLVYSNTGYQAPRFYNPNDYTQFVQSTNNSRPKYYNGFGYMCVNGSPDQDGLPTVWYNDNGKYLIPTKYDIENERVPIIITNRNDKCKIPEKKKVEERTSLVFITSRSEINNEDGLEYTRTYNSETKQVTLKLKIDESKYDSYLDMGSDAVTQMKNDDTLITTNELSRYNVELADLFCWLKNVVELKVFIRLKRECHDQLRAYRDLDPLCLYKSTVMIIGDNTVVLKPKPADLEILNKDISKVKKEIDHTSFKLDNIYLRYVNDLNNASTLEEKLKVIRSARDIELIKRSDDNALKMAKEIFDKLEPIKKSNFMRYKFWKSIYRSKYMDEGRIDKLEIEYSEWWNKPRESMSQNEYDFKYSIRMAKLAEQKFHQVQQSQPIGNPIVVRNGQLAVKEWERLSEGRFNKPNMTLDEYLVAVNVTNYNIDKECIMRRRIENIRSGKTNTTAFEHSILDKVIDRNINQLGLSQVMKLPRYAPVSLSGIDKTMDVETRRQKFIDRIFAMKGRPLV